MIARGMLRACTQFAPLTQAPLYHLNHIKSVWDANLKAKAQEIHDSQQLIERYDRVYKPTYTIEFNRVGEVLLYSCNPFKHSEIYLKYPYVMYETMIPISVYLYFTNALNLPWYWNNVFYFLPFVAWIPRMWYFRSLQYKVHKLWLLRGGKVVKIETMTLMGDRNTTWSEIYQFHPLTADLKNFDDRDNADFLQEEGQLKYELATQLDHYQDLGVTVQDEVLYFMKQGIVHQPELFEAVCKGYNVDTSDFVINTANNLRAREGNHNQ